MGDASCQLWSPHGAASRRPATRSPGPPARLGKRQLEQLGARAAADFEAFYTDPTRNQATATEGDLLVLSADGKGIVMQPDALRPATAKAVGQATTKLATRLSKDEKHTDPTIRNPTDMIGRDDDPPRPGAPKAFNKWLTAIVVDTAATVIGQRT